jgi:hypothetical protein
LQYKRPKNTNGGLWAAGENQRNLFLRSNSSSPDPLNQLLHSSCFLRETRFSHVEASGFVPFFLEYQVAMGK